MQDDYFFFGDVHTIKYHPCPDCQESALLHVDLETDSKPCLDAYGRRQYYCLRCRETFPVGAPIIPIRR